MCYTDCITNMFAIYAAIIRMCIVVARKLRQLRARLFLWLFDTYMGLTTYYRLWKLPQPTRYTEYGKAIRVYSDRDLTPQYLYYTETARDLTFDGFTTFLSQWGHKPYAIVKIVGSETTRLKSGDAL